MTTYSNIQFFPLPELRNRAKHVGDNVKAIKIYSGDQGRKGSLVYEIRRTNSGEFPEAAFDYFEGRYNGIYTAIFSNGGETMYLESSQSDNNYRMPFSYPDPMNGTVDNVYKGFRPEQFIQRILELENENRNLKEDVEALNEDLKQFSTLSGKFEYALINIFQNYALPLFSQPHNAAQPMQGTPQQQFNSEQNMNWRTHQVTVPGNADETLNNAIDVLCAAFGEENLVRIAMKLQQQPNLVNTLISMI